MPCQHLRRRRANVALEFAFILPVWLAIVFAIMEFGWAFYRLTALDAAANVGCRAGSLIDPGENDQNVPEIEDRARQEMVAYLIALGDDECLGCTVQASTVGAPPSRSLVCRVSRSFEPIIGLYMSPTTLHTVQVARLEWQRERAP